MKKIYHHTEEASRADFRGFFPARGKNAGRKVCLLTFVVCVFATSWLTHPTIDGRINDSTNLTRGLDPTIRRRAVLQVGVTSDKPLIGFSDDGQLIATGTGEGPVKVWNVLTGTLIATPDGTNGQSPRAFSPADNRLLASANMKSVSLYDVRAMKLKSSINLAKLFGGLNFFGSFSPDGQWFIINTEDTGKVSLWKVETAELIFSVPCKLILFNSRFSHDSKTLLTSCGDSKATLWDIHTGKSIFTFSSPRHVAVSDLSPDSKTVAMATDYGQVLIWDATNGQLRKVWQGHRDLISDLGFSRDGKLLATVSRDGNAILWDIENLKLESTLRVGSGALAAVFSPDSRLVVVVGGKRELTVWDAITGLPVFGLTGHRKEIQNVEFSSDGRLLVSSSDDAVNVWDVANRKDVAKLNDASFPAQFSKDGRTLATSGLKGTVILWEVVLQ
jgi:WD40 repeat protein